MSVYFENIRDLVELRTIAGTPLHAVVDPTNRRVVAFTNFNMSPRILLEKSEDFPYEIVYNLQKIMIAGGGEIFRPRIKARSRTPWVFSIKEDTLYDADSVGLPQEKQNEYLFVAEKIAALDLLFRIINTKRRDLNNGSLFGQDKIYAQKLREAVHVRYHVSIGEGFKTDFMPYLRHYAELAGITMEEAADNVFDRSLAEKDQLVVSENERMILTSKIIEATSTEELYTLMQEYAEANQGQY
jgi:hypothetical protein